MDKIELIAVLEELTEKFQPKIFHKVREEIGSEIGFREQKLLDYVFENYYRKDMISGRWYDPFSYHFLHQFRPETGKN